MSQAEIQLNPEWLSHLQTEFDSDYMQQLKQFLQSEKQQGKTIYPQGSDIFNALNTTALSKVKVVVIGQDPYHGANQAHGLSFSVPEGVAIPPSLVNIYKEQQSDLNITQANHGNLTAWANQGVLLLNSVLTVQAGMAASHQGKGWERFTDKIVEVINQQCSNVVFLLWGAYAQKKGAAIDANKHCVLKAPHPSPLSAHRGFFGCQHFSKANAYLQANHLEPIDWQIS